ncbi:MAG: trimethylamine methyltransferase family protein [Verrucomicrobia bacterium]|nr:trimethylamine methyltransferase family protein [Verrucomicrobiota bacterium]
MKNPLFSASRFDQMAEEVVRVLSEVGYWVDHPEVRELAIRGGCRESACGRLLFMRRQVEELRAELRRQYPPKANGVGAEMIHPKHECRTGFGNLSSKFHDYDKQQAESGNTRRLEELVKFGQADPRVASMCLPLSRSDVPAALEQLDGVLRLARLTNKPIGDVDATVPESVPYLAEMGRVLGAAPARFVGSCNCINPPLRLEERTAATMLQRRPYHSRSMITSMPAIGGSGPVDIHGCAILATAEIVGGLILSRIVDPDAPLLGYIACIQVDMRKGGVTSSSPQTVRLDAAVYQLMNHAFGGGTAIGGRSYVSARRPGLQAVFERFLKAVGYALLADSGAVGYAGNGNLDNGSMISPEQLLLDMEIFQGLDMLWTAPEASSSGDVVRRIGEVVRNEGGNFLTVEHTLEHFRDEMWAAAYFQCQTNTRTEKEILDRCHADYRQRVGSYEPASYPPEVVRELDQILNRARSQLL